MGKITYFAVFVLLVAGIIAYIQSTLKYSILFYLPGIMGKYLIPTQPYKEIVWKSVEPRETSRPNIVLIIADDLGHNDLFGGAGVETPRIESIAVNGISFSHAYAGHATCCPSRAALFTGRGLVSS